MRIVVALGGNALLERGERPESALQEHHVRQAIRALAPLAREHQLVITHGNGPQVGMLALESASDPAISRPYPFDVLGAQTQGMIGYWIVQALDNAGAGPAACVVCRTEVDPHDPAFASPSKFVGPVYSREAAGELAAAHGWTIRQDGASWRRVVPSPEPAAILELPVLQALISQNVTVVCAGGGGIPVFRADGRSLRGVEAVVDKDLTAALLARSMAADALLMLTDVAGIESDFGTDRARLIPCLTVEQVREMALPAGSMGPKAVAACRFVTATGGLAAIGRLADAALLLDGKAGTRIVAR